MSQDLINLCLLPLPETVLFPGMNLPVLIYEEIYKKLIQECIQENSILGIVLFEEEKLKNIGTLAEIIHCEDSEDNGINVLLEGKERFKIISIKEKEPYLYCNYEFYTDIETKLSRQEKEALKSIKHLTKEALLLYDSIAEKKHSQKIKLPSDPNELLFLIAGNLTCTPGEKQTILETSSIPKRIDQISPLLDQEIEKLNRTLQNKSTKNIVSKNGFLEH